MTFKKPEMEKTLRNGLSMSEMDPLNHRGFPHLVGTGIAPVSKKTAIKRPKKILQRSSTRNCFFQKVAKSFAGFVQGVLHLF